jgi:type II secretory pathway pseudopilin PulG
LGTIIELFLQNPLLLILLIGAITGLFGKKSKQEEQKRRQQQRQQRQSEQQTEAQTQSSYPNNETGYREARTEKKQDSFDWDIDIFNETKEELEKKVRETLSPYLEKKKAQVVTAKETAPSAMKKKVQELSIKQQEIAKNSPILKQELQLSEGRVVKSHKINPKRVVEGVMWAEILGQPRSRNPHTPIYSQHYAASRRKG